MSDWIPRGQLMERVGAASRRATEDGSLCPLRSHTLSLEQDGHAFLLRVVRDTRDKDATTARVGGNPFLPHDPRMYVGELSPVHRCLLNRFNVVPDHFLVVTRDFQEQTHALSVADFEVALRCLAEADVLVFFNGGAAAGASVRHRHLQVVPLPLGPGTLRYGLEPAVRGGSLPFRHALLPGPWSDSDQGAARLHAWYADCLVRAGWRASHGPSLGVLPPYNLLLSREAAWWVPRTPGYIESFRCNALGFAGGLLVRGLEQQRRVEKLGPLSLLWALASPDQGGADP